MRFALFRIVLFRFFSNHYQTLHHFKFAHVKWWCVAFRFSWRFTFLHSLTLSVVLFFADPRTRDWPMMSSPLPTLVICLSYAYIVKVSIIWCLHIARCVYIFTSRRWCRIFKVFFVLVYKQFAYSYWHSSQWTYVYAHINQFNFAKNFMDHDTRRHSIVDSNSVSY